MSHSLRHSPAPTDFQEFAYAVSHDFNAPLRAVVQFSHLLAEENRDKLDGEAQEYLDLIISSGQKMQRMLDALLDFSRLDSQAKPFVRLDSGKVLEEACLVLADEIRQTRAKIHHGKMPLVLADHDQLLQLFVIILRNALLFQPSGQAPEVTITHSTQLQNAVIVFDDNGIGIKEAYYDRVFKPFQRLHNERDYPGIGMGLTLARKIVAQHQGQIALGASRSGGLSVMLTLPQEDAEGFSHG